jgi:hypothetical protein
MSSEGHLIGLLEEWRRLTDLEGQAIRSENWEILAAQQEQKKQLRRTLDQALEMSARTPSDTSRVNLREEKLQAMVSVLVALEKANLELLSSKSRNQQLEMDRANGTSFQLQGVRRAYGDAAASHWQSYS